MFWKRLCELCKKYNTNPSKVASDLGFSNATATKWKKGSIPNGTTLDEMATYFNVSTDYLLGRTNNSSINQNDNDIKNAIFNTSDNITDEMLDEVKQFAEMVKMREENKRKYKITHSKNDDEIDVFIAARSEGNTEIPKNQKMKKSEWERLNSLPDTDDDF